MKQTFAVRIPTLPESHKPHQDASSSACRQIRDSDALIEPCYDVIEACQYTLDERIELQSTSAYIVDEMVLQGQTSRQRIVCYA